MLGACHEVFQTAFGGVLAGPESFVSMQQQGADEVGIESADDIARVRDELVMVAQELPDNFPDLGFASALCAAERKRCSNLFVGMLKNMREPSDDPLEEVAITTCHVGPDMIEE